MSFTIIDKRSVNRDRSAENRQRFLKRIRGAIKEQMPDLINNRSLKDMSTKGGSIKINKKSLREPEFRYGDGGDVDRVLPGNKEYVPGDTILKPRGGSARGRQGTPEGEGEDDFIVEISRDEFLNYLFDGLELPDMLASEIKKLKESKRENIGFQVDGSPNRLSIVRSFKQSLARRIPIKHYLEGEIKELEEALLLLTPSSAEHAAALLKLEELKKKLGRVPLFDDVDLRYRASIRKDQPVSHAVMFLLMDNSGSMQLKEKTIARKFFWLLYSFLEREYDSIELVFISHTTTAHEMSETDFFNTSESGGTIVSSALELTAEIIKERYANKTNIYVAQVSDGDNWEEDNGTCTELLEDDILPFSRYYAYIQVDRYHEDEEHTSGMYQNGLWKSFNNVAQSFPQLQAKRVVEENEIYGVFHQLFSKKVK